MSEAVKAAQCFAKKNVFTKHMHTEVSCKPKIGSKMTHIQIEHVKSWIFVGFFSNCVMCACTAVRLYLTSFSSVQTQGRLLPLFFPFHMVLPGRSRPAGPTPPVPSRKTPGGGPVPPSSGREGSAPRGESPGDAGLDAQPRGAPVAAGEAG